MVIEETKSEGVRKRGGAGVCVLKKKLKLKKLKAERRIYPKGAEMAKGRGIKR